MCPCTLAYEPMLFSNPLLSPLSRSELFDKELNNSSKGIGLKAIQTYIYGLNGSCGARGSTFWVKFPLGQVDGMTVKNCPLSFQSLRSERLFRVEYIKMSKPFFCVVTAIGLVVFFGMYSVTYPGTIFEEQPWIFVLTALLLGVCLCMQSYHAHHLTNEAVNDDIDNASIPREKSWYIGLRCCHLLRCKTFPGHEDWTIFFSISICFIYLLIDVLHTVFVIIKWNGFSSDGTYLHLPGSIYILFGFVSMVVVGKLLMLYAMPVFYVMSLNRILMLIVSSKKIDLCARALHVILVFSMMFGTNLREREMRTYYKAGFMRDDLIRDRQTLERSGQVKKKEIEQEAAKYAAHKISYW